MKQLIKLFIVLELCVVYGCQHNKVEKQNITQNHSVIDLFKDSIVFTNDTIVIYKIDSVAFFKAYTKEAFDDRDSLAYVSDLNQVKDELGDRVIFGGYNEETGLIDSSIHDGMIFKINFSNGKEVFSNGQMYFWDMGFSRYYPTEDILLCEGGHTSDFSFDLKNGIVGPELVGNPDYIRYSPSKQYRLNGWFPGQECSDYFLQIRNDDRFDVLVRLPMSISKEGFDFCTLKDIFWTDDSTLYFRNFYYGDNADNRLGFFRLEINPSSFNRKSIN